MWKSNTYGFAADMQLMHLMKAQGRGKKKTVITSMPRKKEETQGSSGYYFAMNRDLHMEDHYNSIWCICKMSLTQK